MSNYVRAGFSAYAMVRAGGAGAPGSTGWEVISLARDVTLSVESAEIDVSSRGGAGWMERIPGLRDLSADVEMLDVTDDAAYGIIRTAFLNRTNIGLHVLSSVPSDPNLSNVQGPRFDAIVLQFTRNEPLNDVVTWNVRFAKARGAVPTWTEYIPPP